MSSNSRASHVIRAEKTLAIPRHFVLFDTETNLIKNPDGSVTHTLKLGWAVYYRRKYGRHLEVKEWFYFTSPDDFWYWLDSKTEPKQRLWVIARNMVFDFTVVEGWSHLRHFNYKLKFFHSKGSTSIISVRRKPVSIVFVDSLNWFRESLEETGRRLGIPKLKIDFNTASVEYLSTYCKRDVEIELANLLDFIKFLSENQISRLCYTIGSTAMAAYLLNCYDTEIYIHNNQQAIDLERDSYKGGRVECHYLGELNNGLYYIVDVNSLYPFVMQGNAYPVKYKQITHNLRMSVFRHRVTVEACIAKVRIRTSKPVFGVRRDRLIFPIGQFWTTLTTPELKYALVHNMINKIDCAVFYEQKDLFTHYVDKLYTLRAEFKKAGVKNYEHICKLLLNSLYGKFGQKAELWEKIGDAPDEPDRVELLYQVDGKRVKQIRYLLGEIFELSGTDECFNSFPAIASHVTAYARMYLWHLIQVCGDSNWFYCDTDSLCVNETGLRKLEHLLDESKLGYLKLEKSSSQILIRGLKDYTIGDKNVIKGIRKSAVEVETGVFQQESWPSFRGTLRSGRADTYTVSTLTKTLNRVYSKGLVTGSGDVTPYVLDEC